MVIDVVGKIYMLNNGLVWVMIDHQITVRVCDIQRVRELGLSLLTFMVVR